MPIVWLVAISLVGGAVWGATIGADTSVGWAVVFATWLLAAIGVMCRSTVTVAAATSAGCFAVSCVSAAEAQARALDSPLRRMAGARQWIDIRDPPSVLLSGRLQDDAVPTAYGGSFVLEVERVEEVPSQGTGARVGTVSVAVTGGLAKGRLSQWTRGRRIRAPVTLRRPLPFRNPGVPDQDVALARRGISLLGSVKSGALIESVGRAPPWTEAGAVLRRWIRRAVGRVIAPIDAQAAALVLAVLIGDRAGLDEVVVEAMRDAGTYHVVAISGGNVACVTALVLFVLARIGVRPRPAALAALVTVSAYGALTTGGSSVARATVAAGVFLVARAIDLRASPVTVLGAAAVLVCAFEPLAPFDLGFWLTFAASAGLVGAMPLAARSLRVGRGRAPATVFQPIEFERGALSRVTLPAPVAWLATLGVATLAAEAAVVPIAALSFGRLPLGGLVANAFAVPLMAIVQVAGAAASFLAAVSSVMAVVAARVAVTASRLLVATSMYVASYPSSGWVTVPPGWAQVAVYYAGLGGALAAGGLAVRGGFGLAFVAGLAAILAPPPATGRDGLGQPVTSDAGTTRPRLTVTFLDVGQGDAAVVRFPAGETMLIDAGGTPGPAAFDIGERVVRPALWALGVRRLTGFVASHGDPDHIGGAAAVIDSFAPRAVWTGIPVAGHRPLLALQTLAARRGSSWLEVRRGDDWHAGEVELRVAHPPSPDWERRQVRNDDSVVLTIRYGRTMFVFTGDVGRAAEDDIAGAIQPAPRVVLKVGHHGSATSTTEGLLARLRPTLAVVSAARHNRFGHPAPAVLGRLAAAGTQVLRTDQEGAIAVDTDGRDLRVASLAGRRFNVP